MTYDYRRKDKNLSFSDAVDQLRRADIAARVVPYINHQHPDRVRCIKDELTQMGIAVEPLTLDKNEYERYLSTAEYGEEYYSDNFIEKSLEHFICIKLLSLTSKSTFIDIASEHSPLCGIIRATTGCKGFMQDIMYPLGINGDRIGGDAAALPVNDGYFTAATATCSLEHFEGDADIRFMKEMARVLQHKGKVVVVPLYMYPTACYVTDPTMSAQGDIPFDEPVLCIEGWGNRHARFYSSKTLYERIIKPNPTLNFTVYALENPEAFADPIKCYCRFILLGEKRLGEKREGRWDRLLRGWICGKCTY